MSKELDKSLKLTYTEWVSLVKKKFKKVAWWEEVMRPCNLDCTREEFEKILDELYFPNQQYRRNGMALGNRVKRCALFLFVNKLDNKKSEKDEMVRRAVIMLWGRGRIRFKGEKRG